MNKSQSVIKLSGALVKAQAEMPSVKFDATNPFLRNKYASLGAVIETAKPVLAKNGIAVVQTPVSDGDKIGVTTLLMHESGEWLEDTIMLEIGEEKGKSRAQVAGSIVTYLRRYSISAILNMYADEDTDGHNGNSQKPEQPKPEPKAPAPQPTKQAAVPATDEHKKLIAEFSASFNGVPIVMRGQAKTPNIGKATDEEIRAAIEHNKSLAVIQPSELKPYNQQAGE